MLLTTKKYIFIKYKEKCKSVNILLLWKISSFPVAIFHYLDCVYDAKHLKDDCEIPSEFG